MSDEDEYVPSSEEEYIPSSPKRKKRKDLANARICNICAEEMTEGLVDHLAMAHDIFVSMIQL